MRAWSCQFVMLCGAALALSGCEQSSDALPSVERGAAELTNEPSQPSEGADSDARHARSEAKPAPPPDDGRPIDKTFDDIKFDIEPDAPFDRSMLTDPIEDLAGRRIRIRGWILPTARRKGIKQFVLVRDNQECCFGDGAALYDCILVSMAPGASAEFSTRSVAVTGEFQIEEFRDFEGKTRAVYRMVGEQVR